jgi:hypothetical protein
MASGRIWSGAFHRKAGAKPLPPPSDEEQVTFSQLHSQHFESGLADILVQGGLLTLSNARRADGRITRTSRVLDALEQFGVHDVPCFCSEYVPHDQKGFAVRSHRPWERFGVALALEPYVVALQKRLDEGTLILLGNEAKLVAEEARLHVPLEQCLPHPCKWTVKNVAPIARVLLLALSKSELPSTTTLTEEDLCAIVHRAHSENAAAHNERIYANETEEEKKIRRDRVKQKINEWIRNLSPEQAETRRQAHAALKGARADGLRRWRAARTPLQIADAQEKSRVALRTPGERARRSARARRLFAAMTQEQRDLRCAPLRAVEDKRLEGIRRHHRNLTEEQRITRAQRITEVSRRPDVRDKVSRGLKTYRENLTPKRREELREATQNAFKNRKKPSDSWTAERWEESAARKRARVAKGSKAAHARKKAARAAAKASVSVTSASSSSTSMATERSV